jgi:mRNA interferase HicA
MKGSEFVRKLRKLGRTRGEKVEFVAERGKGSHGTLYYGKCFTVVRDLKDELKKGTLHGMLAQLGLKLEDLQEKTGGPDHAPRVRLPGGSDSRRRGGRLRR